MTRACRNCQAPIGPRKQLCEACRLTLDKMRRLDAACIDLRMEGACPRCHQPWRTDRSRAFKICQACADKGEVTKSKLTAKQRRELIAKLNRENYTPWRS
jgi:predicted amidophosphoribosyltransferase